EEGGRVRAHYRNGDVFVRRNGRTERATAEDLRMLERRLLAGAAPRSGLDVQVVWADQEEVVQPVDLGDEGLERWLSRERTRLQRTDSTTAAGSVAARRAPR